MDRIIDNIAAYANNSPVRFHMPGHNGKPFGSHLDGVIPYDVTELEQTDDLYSPTVGGVVDSVLSRLSEFYKTNATVISAGGATLCLQSAIFCAKKKYGLPFSVDCRCHKSVFNALCLCDADVTFFDPHADVADFLSESPSIVVVTSPDYYGRMTDIEKLKKICHKDSLLIVDNSHGSHLYYSRQRSLHPLCSAADLVVDSIHKTLPALTGAALLHSRCDITRSELLDGMRLFGSTSPSFLISSSADACCTYMRQHGLELLDALLHRIDDFTDKLEQTDFYRKKYTVSDPYRLVISSKYGEDMHSVSEHLQKNNIVPEFSDDEHTVLIPSAFSSDGDFDALFAALCSYSPSRKSECVSVVADTAPVFKPTLRPSHTLFANKKRIGVAECEGAVAAELKYVYPPGIPYVIPGVTIDKKRKQMLDSLKVTEITVIDK